MAEILDNGEFWLPSHFLTDDDMLLDKENFGKNGVNTDFSDKPCFPTEFPYGFDSFGSSALNSPVESVVSSTETESDEEDLLAGLTRQLVRSTVLEAQKLAPPEKTWVLSGSPQSTLSGIGCWSGCSGSPNGPSQVSSPPTTPLSTNNDAWDLIYAAAGQVARLKMASEGPRYHHHYQQSRGLLSCPGSISHVPVPPVKKPASGFYVNQNQSLTHNMSDTNQLQNLRQDYAMKQQHASVWGRHSKEGWLSQQNQLQPQQVQNRGKCVGHENGRCGRPLGLPQSAWPPLQLQQQNRTGSGMRAVFLGGSGMRRESTGTGVFLPRRYGNPSDPRKKQGCSTVLLPARVVQALNLNFEDMNTSAQLRFNNGFAPDYEVLMARRNALLLQQQKRSPRPEALNNEIRLPQEWTY